MIHHYIIFFILLKTLKIELNILTLFFAIISLRMDDIFAFPSSCSMCFAISIAWTSFSLTASATALIRSVSFNIFWVLCFCWATSCCVHSTYIKDVNSYTSSNIPNILKYYFALKINMNMLYLSTRTLTWR